MFARQRVCRLSFASAKVWAYLAHNQALGAYYRIFWIFKRRLRNVAYKESFLRSVSR